MRYCTKANKGLVIIRIFFGGGGGGIINDGGERALSLIASILSRGRTPCRKEILSRSRFQVYYSGKRVELLLETKVVANDASSLPFCYYTQVCHTTQGDHATPFLLSFWTEDNLIEGISFACPAREIHAR